MGSPNEAASRPRDVTKLIHGTPPGELPIEFPTQMFLSINLKTAKALGIAIEPKLLARADEVIE